MVFKNSYIDDSETKAWNVARSYSEIKILKWLILADEYELVATFGSSSLIEEMQIDNETKEAIRLRSLRWLNKILLMIASNTLYLLKPKDIEKMKKIKSFLLSIKIIIKDFIDDSRISRRDGSSIYRINDERFDLIINALSEIKCEMIEPLNKSELIFTSMEEFNPDKVKAEIMKRLSEVG